MLTRRSAASRRARGIDPGRFIAYIGTSPDNLDRAIAGLRGEISSHRRRARESRRNSRTAKAYLTGSFVFHFQKNLQIADFLVEAEIYALGFDYLEKYPELIRDITVDDITRAVARKYIDPERLTTVVVGPVDEHGRVMNDKLKRIEGSRRIEFMQISIYKEFLMKSHHSRSERVLAFRMLAGSVAAAVAGATNLPLPRALKRREHHRARSEKAFELSCVGRAGRAVHFQPIESHCGALSRFAA